MQLREISKQNWLIKAQLKHTIQGQAFGSASEPPTILVFVATPQSEMKFRINILEFFEGFASTFNKPNAAERLHLSLGPYLTILFGEILPNHQ